MKWFVRETNWLPESMRKGWGNGYVVIPKGHPLYGKDYMDYDLDIHGGVTFASFGKDFNWDGIELRDDDWVIGFDTNHSYDTKESWTKSNVISETKRLAKLVERYRPE